MVTVLQNKIKQRTRTPQSLTEMFRQLAVEPLTEYLSEPVLYFLREDYGRVKSEELFAKLTKLICQEGFNRYPDIQGYECEMSMLLGDVSWLIDDDMIGQMLKSACGKDTDDKTREIIRQSMMLLEAFLAWSFYSEEKKEKLLI